MQKLSNNPHRAIENFPSATNPQPLRPSYKWTKPISSLQLIRQNKLLANLLRWVKHQGVIFNLSKSTSSLVILQVWSWWCKLCYIMLHIYIYIYVCVCVWQCDCSSDGVGGSVPKKWADAPTMTGNHFHTPMTQTHGFRHCLAVLPT